MHAYIESNKQFDEIAGLRTVKPFKRIGCVLYGLRNLYVFHPHRDQKSPFKIDQENQGLGVSFLTLKHREGPQELLLQDPKSTRGGVKTPKMVGVDVREFSFCQCLYGWLGLQQLRRTIYISSLAGDIETVPMTFQFIVHIKLPTFRF